MLQRKLGVLSNCKAYYNFKIHLISQPDHGWEVVTELIQADFNTKTSKKELTKLLEPNYRKQLLEKYDLLEKIARAKKCAVNCSRLKIITYFWNQSFILSPSLFYLLLVNHPRPWRRRQNEKKRRKSEISR
jgi:hypothetical protein